MVSPTFSEDFYVRKTKNITFWLSHSSVDWNLDLGAAVIELNRAMKTSLTVISGNYNVYTCYKEDVCHYKHLNFSVVSLS